MCGKSTYSRGLCQTHYRRWLAKYDAMKQENPAAADRFEADCIRDGWLIPKSKGGRRKGDDDPFDDYAIRALAEETDQVIAEGHADIDDALRAYRANKVAEEAQKFDKRKRNSG